MEEKPAELKRIKQLIKKGELALGPSRGLVDFGRVDSALFSEFRSQSQSFLNRIFGPEHPYSKSFQRDVSRSMLSHIKTGIGILKGALEDLPHLDILEKGNEAFDPIAVLLNLFERFHLVARQLRSRHDDRETLRVGDEYDVQDLLHSQLLLFFDDIRPEESTPSYAGGSSRMDFLLKNEQIVIEIKRSAEKLTAKELANQLIEDIDRYKTHPDCKILLCFIYDPEGHISNPRGIETDLSREGGQFPVRIVIRP